MWKVEGSGSVVAEDRAFPPQGFRLIIAGSMNFKIVGEGRHGPELLNLSDTKPDLSGCRLAGVPEWGINLLEENRRK